MASRIVMQRRWKARSFSTRWRPGTVRAERGEVWQVDFGIAAKVRPALLLTGEPADDQLDLFTVLLHTTALQLRLSLQSR